MKLREGSRHPLPVARWGESVRRAAWKIWIEGCRLVAVVRDHRLAGIITAESLAAGSVGPQEDDERRPVQEFLHKGHPTISWDKDRETALDLMTREGLSRLPVLDDRGAPWGLVHLNDLLLQLAPPVRATRSPRGSAAKTARARVG